MFNNYEIVEYTHSLPFQIQNFTGRTIQDDRGDIKDVLEHWHQEIEIVYTFEGHALHYIDGKVHRAAPGKLFVTNSESIHKVISDEGTLGMPEVIAVVLLVIVDFVKKLVPNLEQMYFLPEADSDMEKIEQLMKEFSYYAGKEKEHEPYENLRLMSMLYELMYLLCRDDLVVRETVFPINNQKNLERLRGIMQYVEVHYTEEITQYEVAKRFYFTKEYFSRFFKKNTGMTFKEYVMHYRLKQAYDPIVYTERSILDIALDCGFADARGLINAFKRVYGDTPYQYRKMHMQKKEHEKIIRDFEKGNFYEYES